MSREQIGYGVMAAEKVLSAAAALAIVTTSSRWITFLSPNLSRNCFLVCSLLSFNQNSKLLANFNVICQAL